MYRLVRVGSLTGFTEFDTIDDGQHLFRKEDRLYDAAEIAFAVHERNIDGDHVFAAAFLLYDFGPATLLINGSFLKIIQFACIHLIASGVNGHALRVNIGKTIHFRIAFRHNFQHG